MGATNVTETRLAALQDDLAAASSTSERIAVLAAMIELAAEQGASGEETRARSLLSRVLADLEAMASDLEPAVGLPSAAACLPDGGDDYLMVLFLQAEASLLRDDDTGSFRDLDVGIDCLRRLREWLPADDQDRVEVDTTLARALMTRMYRAGGRRADIDEAGALLASLLDLMDSGDPGRRRIISALAVQRAVRYAGYDGSAADRGEALRYAAEAVRPQANGGNGPDGSPAAVDGDPDEPAIGGHLVIAWMTLIRQFTSAQRSAMLWRADLEAARRGAAPALLSEQGTWRSRPPTPRPRSPTCARSPPRPAAGRSAAWCPCSGASPSSPFSARMAQLATSPAWRTASAPGCWKRMGSRCSPATSSPAASGTSAMR